MDRLVRILVIIVPFVDPMNPVERVIEYVCLILRTNIPLLYGTSYTFTLSTVSTTVLASFRTQKETTPSCHNSSFLDQEEPMNKFKCIAFEKHHLSVVLLVLPISIYVTAGGLLKKY